MLGPVLDDPMPDVSAAQAERLAEKYFAVRGAATALAGERDRNFQLVDGSGSAWVLKVVHPAEHPQFTALQSEVLLHISERDPELPVPRVRMTADGDTSAECTTADGAGIAGCRVRMYSYLRGTPLPIGESSSDLRVALGVFLGRLDNAMSDLRAEVRPTGLAWDAQHVSRFQDVLADSEPELTAGFFEHFARHVTPALARTREQLIHNDFNPRNVLLADDDPDTVVGVIDFGDLVYAPLVQDLATAAAYQVSTEGHPLQGPGDVIRGYHRAMSIEAGEFEVLLDLIRARLMLTIAITSRRVQAGHADPSYILRNSGLARRSLRRLAPLSCEDAADLLRTMCGVG